jgi:hypothetical protein
MASDRCDTCNLPLPDDDSDRSGVVQDKDGVHHARCVGQLKWGSPAWHREHAIFYKDRELVKKHPAQLIEEIRSDLAHLRGNLSDIGRAYTGFEESLEEAQGAMTLVISYLHGVKNDMAKCIAHGETKMELSFKYRDEDVGLAYRGRYGDGTPAYDVVSLEEHDTIARITVCVPGGVVLKEDEILIKTWSENEEIAKGLMGTGRFEDTGVRVRAGFCEAQVWKIKRS